jgi:hypothetical protein
MPTIAATSMANHALGDGLPKIITLRHVPLCGPVANATGLDPRSQAITLGISAGSFARSAGVSRPHPVEPGREQITPL